MTKAKILLVEDEKNLGATLRDYLEGKGHDVIWKTSFKESLNAVKEMPIHIALLDIGLPDGDGIELAKKIKVEAPQVAFMFLSAQNDPDVKVKGLDLGAQDYMTKPFNIKELSFRLEKILSFYQQNMKSEELSFGPLKIWFKRYQVQNAHGEILNFGTKEVEILKLLIDSSPNVVSRDEIITKIWGVNATPSYRTVDNYIVTLRKWAETDSENHLQIQSVRGIGYKISYSKNK